ncbi:MAG: type II toxin-antitoxin system antitoxin MazE7 [Solirubrobacteraceae bacterium]
MRDALAAQARERGLSISAMLAEMSHKAELDSILEAERRATRSDARSRDVQAEEREWEAALGDGVD